MFFARLIAGLFAIAAALSASAQHRQPLDTYIHNAWDSLQRSMDDCKSLVDPKLRTAPVLYLPFGEPVPASVKSMQAKCKVDVRSLPRAIHHEGELMPDQISAAGLLYLPNRYVVPGGRFNEMYGWDSYFIILGELADHRLELARGTVENFFYEIDHYGSILNANRTYYLTRSQPPFLSSMVLAVYKAERTQNPAAARAWLARSLPYLQRDHELWTTAPHLAGDTGLARYFDLGHGPVPEMADDSTYYVDVIRWLTAHPDQTPNGYLEPVTSEPNTSCADSANCLKTNFDGEELTAHFYVGDRSMRESGFDTSFRFGPFSGSTQDYAPICLNALLYKYERDIAFIERSLGNPSAALHWESVAAARRQKINSLLWDDTAGLFLDYDVANRQRSDYRVRHDLLCPLVRSRHSLRRRSGLVANLPLFERAGGLQMSTEDTGEQWDAPFGWAPTNWLAVEGLARYGYTADAERIARKFMATIQNGFERDGTIREKYNMDNASSEVKVATGYKQNVVGFGWTNGVYLQMQQLLASHARSHSAH